MTPEFNCDVCSNKKQQLFKLIPPGEEKAMPLYYHKNCKDELFKIIREIMDKSKCKSIDIEQFMDTESFIPNYIDASKIILDPSIREKIIYANKKFIEFSKYFYSSLRLNQKKTIIFTSLGTWNCLYP